MNAQAVFPKYKRQKFLLFFIKQAGSDLSKLDLQKLLSLYHKTIFENYFDFSPYLYWCYSFLANADLGVLQSQGWIAFDGKNIKLDPDKSSLIGET
jgi:hypothetical protein